MKQRIGIGRYWNHLLLKRRRNLVENLLLAALNVAIPAYRKLNAVLTKSDGKTVSRLYLRAKHLERSIIGGKYNFVSVDDLVIWTNEWVKSLPNSYDVIVGIPRSGLLVASLIALKLGKPLSTPELFIQGQYWLSEEIERKGKAEHKNILLVDDSIDTGKDMAKSMQLLSSHCGNLNITKAALMAHEDSKTLVDLYYKIIPHPRLFEWCLVHANKGRLAADLDGVICENCPPGFDSDEELYIEWIRTAKPYIIPVFEIDVIVSNRLEKYRSDTEEWLAQHGVGYKELILWNISSKLERDGKLAQNKIESLLKIKPDIIWESNLSQAKQIWEATEIPVLCVDEMILFGSS